jgi:hypothetical protein
MVLTGNDHKKLGVVAQVCNPSSLRDRDWEDHSSRPAWAKIPEEPISTNKSWVWWSMPIISARWKCSQPGPDIKARPSLKNNYSKNG